MLNLFVALTAVLVTVAWIGWRYFLAPLGVRSDRPVADIRPVPDARDPDKPVEMRVASRTINESRGRIGPRFLMHWSLWLAALLVGMAVTGVFALSGQIALDPLQALDFGRQEHIQSALNPENLVPPPPLPPSAFSGTERPGLETADRDWTKLKPDFARLALLAFARAEARGYPFALLEGYRSPERQDALADAPVHVTNARAFQSKHQYGLALDAAPLKNGRLVISERDPWAMEAYQVLGEEAERAGLIWGGRWKLKDFGHIEATASIAAIAGKK